MHRISQRSTWLVAVVTACIPSDAFCDDALVAPGHQTDQVIEFLQQIINGHRAAQAKVQVYTASGRVSSVNFQRPKESNEPDRTPETMPTPEWHGFVLEMKDGKGRFEEEYIQRSSDGNRPMTSYRLMTKEALYNLNGNSIDILGVQRKEWDWSNMLYSVMNFGEVFDGKHYTPITTACQLHIDRLRKPETNKFFDPRYRLLQCKREGAIYRIDILAGPEAPDVFKGEHNTAWVDSSKGFQVVRTSEKRGGAGHPTHLLVDATTEYQELSNGWHFPLKATKFVANLGTAAKREGGSSWGKRDLEVMRVDIDDVKIGDDRFDPKLLPVPVGTQVEDRRVDPPLQYRLEGPLGGM